MKHRLPHLVTTLLLLLTGIFSVQGQTNTVNIGSDCGMINARNNGNGGANTCPGANNTAVATNFVNTSYASVPSGTKTGDIRIRWVVSGTLYPPAIRKIYETNNGQTVLTTLPVGPAGLPTQSGDG